MGEAKPVAFSMFVEVNRCTQCQHKGRSKNLTLAQSESVRAEFYDIITGELYADESVPLNATGSWTGIVQNLLSSAADFRSGSLIVFYSTAGFFSTTQFIMNMGYAMPGFGFQTFYSEPVPEVPGL